MFKQPIHKMFQQRITKQEVSAMPTVSFNGDIIVVDDEYKIPECVNFLSQQPILGVDTETRPAFSRGKQNKTSLLQISSLTRCYLIQLNHIGLPQPIANILANPDIIKVGLAFSDDLRGLKRITPFEPQNCIDIQSIVHNYGILDLGLQKIYAIIFGQRISKTQRLTNWENKHLTLLQQKYAATDAWATLCIYNALMRSKKLPQKEVKKLLEADKQLQIQHQQEIINAKEHAE